MNFLILSGACRAVRTCSKFRVPAFQNQMVMTHFSTAKETNEKTTPKDTPKPDKTIQPLIEKATQGEDTVDDSEIQAEWLSLEKRLAFRKPKRKGSPHSNKRHYITHYVYFSSNYGLQAKDLKEDLHSVVRLGMLRTCKRVAISRLLCAGI